MACWNSGARTSQHGDGLGRFRAVEPKVMREDQNWDADKDQDWKKEVGIDDGNRIVAVTHGCLRPSTVEKKEHEIGEREPL